MKIEERQRASSPPGSGAWRGLYRQVREDIACVFERDPAARTWLEVATAYPGVHAIIAYRIAHRLWGSGWLYLARLVSYLGRLFTNVDIHPGARVGRRFFIDHGAGVVIGETAVIGDDVTLYHGVTLGGTSWHPGKRHPTLGDRVLVGAGAKVLGPITIGEGSRVGANSVVIADVPPDRTVVGIPGKVVRVNRMGQSDRRRIDLNHHVIPDPVKQALAALEERLVFLESKRPTRSSSVPTNAVTEPGMQREARLG